MGQRVLRHLCARLGARIGVGNTSYGNCIGIVVLSAEAIGEDWKLSGNRVHDNRKACPGSEDGPPASGIGIALLGAQDTTVRGNIITGNQPPGPSLVSGGVVVFSSAPLGGLDPAGNLVQGNVLRNDAPDLFYDGSGTGNRFVDNNCQTSAPDGMC